MDKLDLSQFKSFSQNDIVVTDEEVDKEYARILAEIEIEESGSKVSKVVARQPPKRAQSEDTARSLEKQQRNSQTMPSIDALTSQAQALLQGKQGKLQLNFAEGEQSSESNNKDYEDEIDQEYSHLLSQYGIQEEEEGSKIRESKSSSQQQSDMETILANICSLENDAKRLKADATNAFRKGDKAYAKELFNQRKGVLAKITELKRKKEEEEERERDAAEKKRKEFLREEQARKRRADEEAQKRQMEKEARRREEEQKKVAEAERKKKEMKSSEEMSKTNDDDSDREIHASAAEYKQLALAAFKRGDKVAATKYFRLSKKALALEKEGEKKTVTGGVQ